MDPVMPEMSLSMDRETLDKSLKDALNLLDELQYLDEDQQLYNI